MMTKEHQRDLVRFHRVVMVCCAASNPASERKNAPVRLLNITCRNVRKTTNTWEPVLQESTDCSNNRPSLPISPYASEATGLWQTWTPESQILHFSVQSESNDVNAEPGFWLVGKHTSQTEQQNAKMIGLSVVLKMPHCWTLPGKTVTSPTFMMKLIKKVHINGFVTRSLGFVAIWGIILEQLRFP